MNFKRGEATAENRKGKEELGDDSDEMRLYERDTVSYHLAFLGCLLLFNELFL